MLWTALFSRAQRSGRSNLFNPRDCIQPCGRFTASDNSQVLMAEQAIRYVAKALSAPVCRI